MGLSSHLHNKRIKTAYGVHGLYVDGKFSQGPVTAFSAIPVCIIFC